MKRVVLLLLFIISLLFSETNSSDKTELSITQKSDKIKEYNSLLSEINKKLDLNVWYAKYTNHKIYLEFKKELEKIEKNMEKLRKRDDEKLEEKRKGILNKMHLLDEFKESPFNELLNPQIPQEIPTVKSPFDMVSAFSYLKILKSTKELYQDRMKTFLELILLLRNKRKYI